MVATISPNPRYTHGEVEGAGEAREAGKVRETEQACRSLPCKIEYRLKNKLTAIVTGVR